MFITNSNINHKRNIGRPLLLYIVQRDIVLKTTRAMVMFISLDSFIIFLFRYKLSNRMNSTTIDPDKLDYLPLTQVICDNFHFKYMKLVGH